MMALKVTDALATQDFRVLFGLDSLGDSSEPKSLGQTEEVLAQIRL